MRKLMVIICCLFLGISLYAQKENNIVNLWEYSAPDAPHGYQSGMFDIKEVEGKLTGEVTIQGSAIQIREIRKQDDIYFCSFNIDGQDIDVTLKHKGKNQLEGQAIGGGMDIPFICKLSKK